MERCPPEICHKIFSFACKDDGHTGRSLSLVSRYIHEASKLSRYHSVVLEGVDHIQTFANVLKDTPPQFRRVQHLFISYRGPAPALVESDSGVSRTKVFGVLTSSNRDIAANRNTGPSLVDNETTEQRGRSARAIMSTNVILQGIVSVLDLMADSLQTLTIVTVNLRPFALTPVPLPMLTELTLYGIHDPAAWKLDLHRVPSLRRLHIQGICFGDAIQPLVELTPNLTHLRMSGLEHAVSISRSIGAALAVFQSQDEVRERDVADASNPQSTRPVRRVLVQPRPPRRFGCGFAYGQYASAMTEIERAASNDPERRVMVLKPQVSTLIGDELVKEAKGFWLDRVQGGEGCWREDAPLPIPRDDTNLGRTRVLPRKFNSFCECSSVTSGCPGSNLFIPQL
ncbi:hypothetical protein JAAARDRAFT_449886 [Jaapia argillacea MUCL 33604]|uniref:Uncharacterized protein n=1 Tax=Jaapia argillacea MUCL 33604 TaxID=933084 RepID=A0A067QHP0_9AGAM|nr:hypothetical protein JAAARDRAFT_449886 [Jaapia argillacea MUCL 33604]